MRKGLLALAAMLALAAVAPGLAGAKPKHKQKAKPQPVSLSVQSSRPDMVSGGNALIAVDVPKPDPIGKVRVRRNGIGVTTAFSPDAQNPRRLLGVVSGMRNGSNRISALVKAKGQRGPASLDLFNSPINGPIISGPHQEPFICRTANNGLGAPTDSDCSAPMSVAYQYRTTGGVFKPLADPSSHPSDMAQTTTRTGQTVDYVVRIESGVINRSIYRWAVLSAGGQIGNGWNGRLDFKFGGGCATGYNQGDINNSQVLDDRELSEGYAVASSSLNIFQTACNDVLSAETMSMVKERVIEALGHAPAWTIGEGPSGGSIQTQMTGQNYPGLLQGLIPTQSFPDNSQPTNPDCRLLDQLLRDGHGLGPDRCAGGGDHGARQHWQLRQPEQRGRRRGRERGLPGEHRRSLPDLQPGHEPERHSLLALGLDDQRLRDRSRHGQGAPDLRQRRRAVRPRGPSTR